MQSPWGPAPRGRARRPGFVLPTVIALSVVIGMLVFAYYQGFRHRDVQVRLSTDRAGARWLSRAAVDCMKYAFREAIDPTKLNPPDVDGGTLLPFLLNDSQTLRERAARQVAGRPDHRAFIERLVGSEALSPIDKLAEKLPDAHVKIFVEFRTHEMFTGNAGKVLADPPYKVVEATYTAIADVRKASENYRTTDTIDVHSLLPPAVSKFTFASTMDVNLNTHKVTVRGQDSGGTAPVVLMHSPDDGDPVAVDVFAATPTAQKKLDVGVKQGGDVVKANLDRGFTFLPGTSERPANLQVASGGSPFGEYHSIYQPAGKTSYPVAAVLSEQPPQMKGFHPPDPRDAGVHQAAAVQGAVFGFFEGIDQQQLLGQSTLNAMPDNCSQLKMFGTGTHPSSTAIVGHVNRTMAALSDIGIDRDDSSRDESDQQTAVGKPLPIRDSVDPFLRNANEGQYASDANVAVGQPMTRLMPFSMNGFVQNENALVDMDGDGTRETAVSSEALHSPFPIDRQRWRYSALFEKYEEYAQVMSRYVQFPANFSLHLAGLPLERARTLLAEMAFGKNPPSYADWLLTELRLESRSPFHQKLKQQGAGKYYLDTKEGGLAGLQELIEAGAHGLYPAETTYVVKGQAKFEEIFMPGGKMDLQGLKVMVVREKPEAKPVLDFDREIEIRAGSGGTLICERFRAKALKNPGEPGKYAPFTLQTGELIMTSKGPFEGVIVPQNIVQEKIPDYTVIRGSLVVTSMPGALSNPLVVTYDARNDPTGPDSALYYRAAFRRDDRVYSVEDRR